MKSKRNAGQLVVEFALSLTVWAALLGGMTRLFQLCGVRQQAHAAARLGALLNGTGRVQESVALEEVKKYLERAAPDGRARWEVEGGRFKETPASVFYRLVKTRVTATLPGARISEQVVVEQEEKEP